MAKKLLFNAITSTDTDKIKLYNIDGIKDTLVYSDTLGKWIINKSYAKGILNSTTITHDKGVIPRTNGVFFILGVRNFINNITINSNYPSNNLPFLRYSKLPLSDRMTLHILAEDIEGIACMNEASGGYGNSFCLNISKSKLKSYDLNGLRSWLDANQAEIQFVTSQPHTVIETEYTDKNTIPSFEEIIL